MNSDESSKNQNSPDVTHSVLPRLFTLPKQEPTPFEKQRALIGLSKQGRLETEKEFAQRIVKAFQEYQAKKADKERRG